MCSAWARVGVQGRVCTRPGAHEGRLTTRSASKQEGRAWARARRPIHTWPRVKASGASSRASGHAGWEANPAPVSELAPSPSPSARERTASAAARSGVDGETRVSAAQARSPCRARLSTLDRASASHAASPCPRLSAAALASCERAQAAGVGGARIATGLAAEAGCDRTSSTAGAASRCATSMTTGPWLPSIEPARSPGAAPTRRSATKASSASSTVARIGSAPALSPSPSPTSREWARRLEAASACRASASPPAGHGRHPRARSSLHKPRCEGASCVHRRPGSRSQAHAHGACVDAPAALCERARGLDHGAQPRHRWPRNAPHFGLHVFPSRASQDPRPIVHVKCVWARPRHGSSGGGHAVPQPRRPRPAPSFTRHVRPTTTPHTITLSGSGLARAWPPSRRRAASAATSQARIGANPCARRMPRVSYPPRAPRHRAHTPSSVSGTEAIAGACGARTGHRAGSVIRISKLHSLLVLALVSERSKEPDSSSGVFARVGSNPTQCTLFAVPPTGPRPQRQLCTAQYVDHRAMQPSYGRSRLESRSKVGERQWVAPACPGAACASLFASALVLALALRRGLPARRRSGAEGL